jgi:hypothetical protein
VQITYRLTPDDFYQGCIAWRTRRKWRRWLLRIAYFIVGAAVLVSLLMLALDRSASTIPTALVGIGFGGVWFAYMLLAPKFFAGRQFKNNPTAQTPIILDASEQGLEFRNPHVESKAAWSAYVAWGEAKSVFIVMPQPRLYFPIPKRAFNEEQLTEFRGILTRNIHQK